jgi:hypothetical protein
VTDSGRKSSLLRPAAIEGGGVAGGSRICDAAALRLQIPYSERNKPLAPNLFVRDAPLSAHAPIAVIGVFLPARAERNPRHL